MSALWVAVHLTADDYDAVCELWTQAGLHFRPAGRDSREEFAAQLASGIQKVIGVHDGGRLVAVAVTTHDSRKGWINRLAVHPAYRRQGLGQFVVREAESVLHDQGMHLIAALIEDGNEASLALFSQAGYIDHPGLHYVSKRDSHDT